MSMARIWAIALLASAILAPGGAKAADELKVLVSIKPVHSLAVAVMEGAGTPELLIKGAGSEHSYTLRPSEARSIAAADMVIRVSKTLETFLDKPIASLARDARVVTLAELPGVRLLPIRAGGTYDAHGHSHSHGHEDHGEGAIHEDGDGDDPHLWLDPANAAAIADGLAAVFAQARPAQAARFKDNADKLKARLAAFDADLAQRLAPVRAKPFITFHDAYQYFEAHYGIASAGAITLSPERQVGAARLKAIRARIEAAHAVCVFAEPQFEPKLVDTLIEGTDARKGVLDPLGADLPEGKEQYFTLLGNLAKSLTACLGASS
jgi:zinc transport system substrate-binding protein